MATRKMMFSLPADLAAQFVKRVPASDRSRYVAEALAARLRERDQMLARAADVANRSRQVRAIEREFDRLEPEILEPYLGLVRCRRSHTTSAPRAASRIRS